MSEELNSQILDALNQGMGPQDIIDHLAASKNPEHQAWVKNYRTNAAQQESSIPAPSATMETPLLNASEKAVGQAANATNDMTLGQKMALGAVAAGAAGAVGLGGYAVKQRIDTNEELRRKRLLGEEISPAVRVQQEQLELQKRQFEASQAGGLSPLEQAKIETEQARKASLELDAEIKRSQLIEKAKAAEIATAKRAAGIPVETPKPTVQQTAAKLGIIPPTAPVETAPPAQLSEWASKAQPTLPEAPIATPEASVATPQAPVAEAIVPPTPVAATAAPLTEAPAAPAKAVPPPVQEVKTGTGKPAFVGQGPANPKKFKTEYATVGDVPKGFAFVPGAQSIDTVRNNLGQDVYTREFTNRDFPANYEKAIQTGNDINRSLNRPSREQMKAQGIVPPEPVEGITKRIAGYKLVKVGGIAGALVAVTDLAKAAQAGDRNAMGEMAIGAIPGAGPQAALYHSSLNPNEQNQIDYLRRMQAAKERGPGNRNQAYDPRKFYSPMPGSLDVPGIAPYR